MPIVERIVAQADVQRCMDIGAVKPQPRNLLQLSGVAHLGALLAEFGKLTMHANQMFESLVADSSAVFQRIRKLGGKVNDVERRMQSLSDAEIAARKFVKTDELTQLQRRSMFMFMSSSTPSSLKVRYNNALPAPMLDRLDEYSADGKRCSANYSYPEFFIEQWLIAEKQRQKEAEQRRIKKREERRARRKKEGDKKGKKQQVVGQRIAVKAVAKKKYNVHGQEFVGSALEPSESHEEQSSTSRLDNTVEPSSRHDLANIAQTPENLSSRPVLAAPSPHYQPQQEPLSSSPPPPPPPPSSASAAIDSPLPPPPPPSAAATVLSAPPAAPMPPPPPAAPMAPPAPAAPPAPPAPPAAPAAPGAPSVPASRPDTGRAALLQSIQHGARLKAVEVPVAAAVEPGAQAGNQHNDLLSQIRLGKQLRPTEKKDSKAKADSHDDVGPYSEIKKLLDRRQFLSPEGSDSGESEDYDSDEWE